jgi:predicted nucleic acid-binding protein
MTYVIDSSVAFKWLVPEADSDKAIQLLDDFTAGVHHLIAPDFFPVEVTHSLTRAERQGRIAVTEASKLLRTLMTHLPDLHDSLPYLPRACDLSSQARLGVYDCVYTALAEHLGCDFITADAKLVAKMKSQFPFVIPLS